MNAVRVLYLTWQHPDTRRIFPIARLTTLGSGEYELAYIRAVRTAQAHGFTGLPGFEEVSRVYVGPSLPQWFEPRGQRGRSLVSPPEPANDTVDLAPLGVFVPHPKGGFDRLEVFAPPLDAGNGEFFGIFVLRGVARDPQAASHVRQLGPREPLRVQAEPGNAYNPRALRVLREAGSALGYVPDYLANELAAAQGTAEALRVSVHRVLLLNHPPAEPLYQVQCRYDCASELGARLFRSDGYAPVAAAAAVLPHPPAARRPS